MPALIALLWIVISLFAQVLIFNHLSLAGGVVLFYLYMAVKLPVELPRPLQIFIGFIVGFILDMFSSTPGLHALACTTIMWMRLPLLHMYVVAEDIKNGAPTLQKLGFETFMRYLISITIVYSLLLYLTEAFTLFNIVSFLCRVSLSVILTFIVLMAVEIASTRR